ncbi:MAG: Ig-like domain-containing protein [Chitinophagaceae bacterium]|nr:Ig-like domain-containing protein [Chitinophagaceae bacterium]
MKTILKLLTAPLLLLCVLAQAQVKTNFNNKTLINERGRFLKSYKATIDFEIPAKNITNLLQAEKSKTDTVQEAQPFQIAVPVSVDLDIAKLMNWDAEGDSAYGKFAIKVNGALSSSINFDKFYLPNGTDMYIYNENGKMITGPVTEKENNPNKIWGSWVYQGPWLTIEIKTPLSTLKQLMLHANNIAYGYKKVYQVLGFGQSAACEINVLCPLGAGWQNERNSVSLILSDNGTSWCSGCLVMNTCNSNRPFYLTANHCFNPPNLPQQNVAAWRFTFQAWSPTCTPSQNSNGVTYNGSTLRANSAGSDFCLVELNNTPPANSGINYAGWSRNTAGINQTTIIHHPAGDVMKITNDVNPPAFGNFKGAQCWHLIVDNGTTEGGSSGSPYFDQNHRVIGQHYGIDDANLTICNQVSKYGGRFDVSWTGGGTNATRLSSWLDPNNSGAMTTNTTNVSSLVPFIGVLSISGSDAVCSATSQYTLNNNGISATGNITWVSSNSNIATVTATGNLATVTKMGNGNVTITATLNACDGIKSVSKTLVVGIPDNSAFNIYQDPSCNGNRINLGAYFGFAFDNCSLWNMGVTDISWDIINGNSPQITNNSGPGVCSQGLNNSGIQVYFPNPTAFFTPYARFKAQNACGWSDWMLRPMPINFQACGSWSFSAVPNPASSFLSVALDENTQATKTDNSRSIQEIQITDKLGNVVKQFKYSIKISKVILDISSLKQDVYFIRVYNGKEWKSESISKQ